MIGRQTFNRVLYTWLPLCVLVMALGGGLSVDHGLLRTITTGDVAGPVQRWAWPQVDGSLFYWNRAQTITMTGILWQGEPGETIWRIVHSGAITVRVDGETVYEAPPPETLVEVEVPIAWTGDSVTLELVFEHDPEPLEDNSRRLLFAVYEPASWGWWLLPTHRLYPDVPDAAVASAELTIYTITTLALVGLILGLLAQVATWAWRTRVWQRREAWIVLALMLLALVVRLVVLGERAVSSPNFYELQPGSDNYVAIAQTLLSGNATIGGAWRQQGMSLWLAGLIRLVGPDFWRLYLGTTLVTTFSAGALAGAGWLLAGRRAGIITGLLVALFPSLVFYQTTLQPISIATVFLSMIVLVGVWMLRHPTWQGAALFGLLTGLGAIVRATTLICGPALFLALLLTRDRSLPWRGWQRVLVWTGIAAVTTLIGISPQTLSNRAVGSPNLLNGSGPVTFYRGFNRDADGSDNYRQAFEVANARHTYWIDAAVDDLEANPRRAAELALHKLGLFWTNIEIANNVSFYSQGVDSSLVLRVLSLNGWLNVSLLGMLGFMGMLLLLQDRTQRTAPVWLMVWMIVGITLLSAAFAISGRIRAYVIPPMLIMVAVTLDHLITAGRARRVDRRLALAGGLALAMMLVLHAFEYQLPRKPFFTGDLPPGVVPRHDNFGGEIALVGVGPIETNHQPGGYAYITLYWQAVAPPTDDYIVFVHLVEPGGTRIGGKDTELGGITYPDVYPTDWPVGEILAESYLVALPLDAPPVLELITGLYHAENQARLPLVDAGGTPLDADFVRFRALGVRTGEPYPTLGDEAVPVTYHLGESLRINRVSVPTSARVGDTVSIGVEWEADQLLTDDYLAFFHLVDANRELVAQSDGPMLGSDWPSSAMIAGMPFGATRGLAIPADLPPGEYLLRMGLYTYPSLDRLVVSDELGAVLPDRQIELGVIQID